MTTPQQPELARSRRSAADPAAAKSKVGGPTSEAGNTGPVPEDNLPGHHPEHDQDKPEGPPPRPAARRAATAVADRPPEVRTTAPPAPRRFRFVFEPRMLPFSAALGITPFTSGLELADGEVRVRFGPWSLRTPLANVTGAEVTGPYRWPKVVGPPHLSLRDRGLTYATTTERGLCIRFREPVAGSLPFGLLRHPAVTVTVERPEELQRLLTREDGA